MKILIISSEFPPGPGGIGTHAYQLTKELYNLGHDLQVICRQNNTSSQEYTTFNQAQSFEIYHLSSTGNYVLKSVRQARSVLRKITKHEPDIVIATGSRMVWITAIITKLQKVQWVAIGHGTEFGFTKNWQAALTRWAFEQSNGTVCVSEFTRDYMLNRGIQPSNVTVIPNGADETAFYLLSDEEASKLRVDYNISPETNLLVTVGNISERKGQEVVIRAMPYILAQHPNTHYAMAGLPTLRPKLEALAEDLGVHDHIQFLGRVPSDDLLRLLNTAELFIMTSRHTATGDFEGYGIAVIEAALCGLPAVVAGDSGLSEAIVPGETGLEVPQNDPIATAEAVNELLGNTARRREMGATAQRRAIDEQTWSQRVQRYEHFLNELLTSS